jgi:hypothetical protein
MIELKVYSYKGRTVLEVANFELYKVLLCIAEEKHYQIVIISFYLMTCCLLLLKLL